VSRLLAVALGALVLLAGVYGLSRAFNARDDAGVEATRGPGQAEPDRGAAHGAKAPARRTGDPPTSGPHEPSAIARDARELTDDQLLHALELGDVVLVYPGATPPAALRALQEDVAGPYDAELAAAGQAVILAREPGANGIQALAWRRRQRATSPGDPALRTFTEYWLGRAPGSGD
jgi:hypothetical protein